MNRRISEKNLESRRNPARIPPQTPPAGGKSAEAGRIQNPRQIVSPCRVLFSSFNHLDFARNSFELCPTNTAHFKKLPKGSFLKCAVGSKQFELLACEIRSPSPIFTNNSDYE